jgi:tetratricopeptide (TPR) repeat protein
VGLAGAGWVLQPKDAPPAKTEKQPETAEEYFRRGLEYLHEGVYPAAYSDLYRSNLLKEHPQKIAYMAYCAGRMGQQGTAAADGRAALDKGATGAAVLNNLGHSLTETGRPQDAIPHLQAALEQAPRMRQARYNLAVARFNIILRNEKATDPACVADIDEVLATGPASCQLLYLAALVYARNSPLGPDVRAKAIRCLDEAVRRGQNTSLFLTTPTLTRNLAAEPEFQRIARMTPGPKEKPSDVWLVEPDGP